MPQRTETEQQVRERAYAIWEREGRPMDRAFEHWIAAEREFEVPAPTLRVKASTKPAKSRGIMAPISRKLPLAPATHVTGTPARKAASLNAGKKLSPADKNKKQTPQP